jgi:hypothetical protein
MNFADLPFDTQTCPISIGMYDYTDVDVVLSWKGGGLINSAGGEELMSLTSVRTLEWQATHVEVGDAVDSYAGLASNSVAEYSMLTASFVLKRTAMGVEKYIQNCAPIGDQHARPHACEHAESVRSRHRRDPHLKTFGARSSWSSWATADSTSRRTSRPRV